MLHNVGANNHDIPVTYIYGLRLQSAGNTKRQFDSALAEKQANFKADAPNAQDLEAEIKYFKMLADLYQQNVNLMDSVVAYLHHEVGHGRMDEVEHHLLYGQMVKWLENMETEMRRVLGLPTSEFGQMLDILRHSIQTFFNELGQSFRAHPKLYTAAVGGAGGAVLMHKFFTGICVSAKLLSKLGLMCGGSCATVGWLTAFACGALGGVFLLITVKAICHALSPNEYQVQDEIANQFKDVQEEVEMVKEALKRCRNDDLLSEMNRIAAFWDHFETFDTQVDENMCPICLRVPRQPVMFRGCTGRHFHCKLCRDEALAVNAGDGRCSVCRAPRPQRA